MLFDKLAALESTDRPTKKCLLGQIMESMEPETLTAFSRVMSNKAISAQNILQILKEEGSDVGITHIRDKRRLCFSGTPCPCIKEVTK
jgi:hypothetical protein